MSGFDWRSASGYDRAQDAEITGFAWECLRRNPNYQRDHRGISRTIRCERRVSPKMGAVFSQLTPTNLSSNRPSSGRRRFCRR